MQLILGLLCVFLFGGFILKLIFGVVGFAFKLSFGLVQLVLGLIGWMLGGFILFVVFAVAGSLLCIPIMILFSKR